MKEEILDKWFKIVYPDSQNPTFFLNKAPTLHCHQYTFSLKIQFTINSFIFQKLNKGIVLCNSSEIFQFVLYLSACINKRSISNLSATNDTASCTLPPSVKHHVHGEDN